LHRIGRKQQELRQKLGREFTRDELASTFVAERPRRSVVNSVVESVAKPGESGGRAGKRS
jgi:hypothetical protein